MRTRSIIVVLGLFLLGAPGGALAAELGDYYLSLESSDSNDLRASLHALVFNHNSLPYDSASSFDVHDAIDLLDEDPDDAQSVSLIYSGQSMSKSNWPAYNREHVWPQSLGAGEGSAAHVDLHHIFACDAGINSARGNKSFDNCEGECSAPDGAPLVLANPTSWEPPDAVKGDLARALFYMDVRFEGGGGEPNLSLRDGTVDAGCDCMGQLSTLLVWHAQDPVDAKEQERNDLVYMIQGNRNPFVDHPEWVALVFAPEVEGAIGAGVEVSSTPTSPGAGLVDQAPAQTVQLPAIGEEDGMVVERSAKAGVGYRTANKAKWFGVGDDRYKRASRGVLSFDTSQLPEGAEVVSASLLLTPIHISGKPFNTLGPLVLMGGTPAVGKSPALRSEDWRPVAQMTYLGTLPAAHAAEQSIAVELPVESFASIEPGQSAQFWLAFLAEDDGDRRPDQVMFASGDHPEIEWRPVLEVGWK